MAACLGVDPLDLLLGRLDVVGLGRRVMDACCGRQSDRAVGRILLQQTKHIGNTAVVILAVRVRIGFQRVGFGMQHIHPRSKRTCAPARRFERARASPCTGTDSAEIGRAHV